jgi:choloylglycine hydrolase
MRSSTASRRKETDRIVRNGDKDGISRGKVMCVSRKTFYGVVFIFSFLLLNLHPARACTYFFLKAKDGSVISGRTQEFYSNLESVLEMVPRDTSFTTTAPDGAKAVSWKSKHGFVGISHYGRCLFTDGLNEKGLAAGGLWFGDSEYPKIGTGERVIDVTDLVGWILGNFQTVAEVKTALETVRISAGVFGPLKMVLPLHFYVTDALGDSIVLEHIKGRLVVIDNTVNGVMTNEPDMSWQLKNLRFYSNMNPFSFPVPELKDDTWSLGTGLKGLPGDYTSESRFVRISALKYFAEQATDAEKGVNLAVHLINVVDIPYGPQIWIQGQKGHVQWTPWIVIYDQKNRHFYYRTYENQILRRIDLTRLPLGEKAPCRRVELYGGRGYLDDTGRFLSSGK